MTRKRADPPIDVTGTRWRSSTGRDYLEVRCPLCDARHVHIGVEIVRKPHCVSPKSRVRYVVVIAP